MKFIFVFPFTWSLSILSAWSAWSAIEITEASIELISVLEKSLSNNVKISRDSFPSDVLHENRVINIQYLSVTQKDPTGSVFIITGRSESYEKYLQRHELFKDLVASRLNIYIHDHRGQGLSDRLLQKENGDVDTSKGHVVEFSDYSKDAMKFKREIFNDDLSKLPTFLLSFSMGGPIALNMIRESEEDDFRGAVLLAPMFGSDRPFYEKTAVYYYYSIYHYICDSYFAHYIRNFYYTHNICYLPFFSCQDEDYFDPKTDYATSGSGYKNYELGRMYNNTPSLRLGGSTKGWVLNVLHEFYNVIPTHNITTPSLIIMAGSDNKISNSTIKQLTDKDNGIFASVKTKTIEGAHHELLFADQMIEKDLTDDQKKLLRKEKMIDVYEVIGEIGAFFKDLLDTTSQPQL